MSIERELLVKTSKELNAVLGLSPNIDVELNSETLELIIKKVSPLVQFKDDFSDDVTKALLELSELNENVVEVFELKLAYDASAEIAPPELDSDVQDDEPEVLTSLPEVPQKEVKVRKRKPHIIRLEELISEGRHTIVQLVKILMSEFPDLKKDTATNYVRNAKTEKYTQFSYLAVEDENGVLRFDEGLKIK